jgi:hypothetical protein
MGKFKIELKWAIYFSIISLLWMHFEKFMGWHDEKIHLQQIYTMLFGIVALIIYIFALLDKKKNYYNNTMDWKQGFVSGAILSLFIAALTPITQYITLEIISPEYFTNIINYTVEKGRMTIEEANKHYNLSSYIYMSTFFGLSSGIVTSAIVSLLVKSKNK